MEKKLVVIRKKNGEQTVNQTVNSKPKKPSGQRRTPRDIWDALMNQKLTIQVRSGTVYKGTLTRKKGDLIFLEDAVVIGRNYEASVDWIWVHVHVVSHIHPEPREVRKIEAD